jgi:hypothetical protein
LLVPSTFLKNKRNQIAYPQVKEAMAARIMKISWIKSKENAIDAMDIIKVMKNLFFDEEKFLNTRNQLIKRA